MSKYLKKYTLSGDAIADSTIISPNVSYIEDKVQVLMKDTGNDGDELEIKVDASGDLSIDVKVSGPYRYTSTTISQEIYGSGTQSYTLSFGNNGSWAVVQ